MKTLGLFVKQPSAGRVKTRLSADVGGDRATALYAAFLGDVVDRFRTSGDNTFLCYTPDTVEAGRYFEVLARDDYRLWRQPNESLGDRLSRFFADQFESGAERVVVIGSDSPTLPASLVTDAFERLLDDDCVVGPATDGGYYLIGQRGSPRPLFEGVDWSGPSVLQQTVARIQAAAASLALLPLWYDVDRIDDLQLLRGHVEAMKAAGEVIDLPRTKLLLD